MAADTAHHPHKPQGTGFTEQQEFEETYGLAVLRVPPHRPSVRRDEPMRLFFYQEVRDSYLGSFRDWLGDELRTTGGNLGTRWGHD